eukprot:2166716-Pyramimonas_sp.AAC.1
MPELGLARHQIGMVAENLPALPSADAFPQQVAHVLRRRAQEGDDGALVGDQDEARVHGPPNAEEAHPRCRQGAPHALP